MRKMFDCQAPSSLIIIIVVYLHLLFDWHKYYCLGISSASEAIGTFSHLSISTQGSVR